MFLSSFFKKNNYFIIFLINLILLILSSCSNFSFNNELTIVDANNRNQQWEINKTKLLNIKNNYQWTLLARAGIVSKQGSASSQIDWVNKPFSINLNNAITFGTIYIKKQNNKIYLDYQDKQYSADDPNKLLYQLTNLNLPITELEYWILGIPSPKYNISNIKLNNYAYIENLKQSSFNISYDNYEVINTDLNNKLVLPRKIIIKTVGLYIKIQVESWKI